MSEAREGEGERGGGGEEKRRRGEGQCVARRVAVASNMKSATRNTCGVGGRELVVGGFRSR